MTAADSKDHTIDVLQSELEYRRIKQGSIFTWSRASENFRFHCACWPHEVGFSLPYLHRGP